MKRSKLFLLAVCLLLAIVPAVGLTASAQSAGSAVGEVKSLADGIAVFNQGDCGADSVQGWIDSGLTEAAGRGSAEFYALTLAQSGEKYDFSAYAAALTQYLDSDSASALGAVAKQRCALALLALGCDSDFITRIADSCAGEQGIMSWVFGLHLATNLGDSYAHEAKLIVEKLLSLRLADGGWALTGDRSDTDVTAMSVQALAPYYEGDSQVKAAVDGALELLASRQNEGGDYNGFGAANAESTAQVLTALTSLGIDGTGDARFIKNGATLLDGLKKYLLPDGSFCHTEGGESSATATVQVFYALTSLWRQQTGAGPLYVFDGLQSTQLQPTSQPSLPSSSQPARDGGFKPGYKFWGCLGAGAAALIACAVLIIKKKNAKNFIFVLLAAALLIGALLASDIKPADEYYGASSAPESPAGTVTLTIRCDRALGRTDNAYLPADGVILQTADFEFSGGDTVYDLLTRAARQYSIQLDSNGAAAGLAYIKGINYLYEFDCGELSGWVYRVNGARPSVGCGAFELSDGDAVEWLYSCELGNDLD